MIVQPDLIRELYVGKENDFELHVQTGADAGAGDMIWFIIIKNRSKSG
ncbi:hypothetical protein IIB79_03795 [candidate division KSB1 bacterium]|nr:hypothetical protein [candidate division KSB1 bacterium]